MRRMGSALIWAGDGGGEGYGSEGAILSDYKNVNHSSISSSMAIS